MSMRTASKIATATSSAAIGQHKTPEQKTEHVSSTKSITLKTLKKRKTEIPAEKLIEQQNRGSASITSQPLPPQTAAEQVAAIQRAIDQLNTLLDMDTEMIHALNNVKDQLDEKITLIHLQNETKIAKASGPDFDWYDELHKLCLPGVPEGEIKRNVDAIFTSIEILSNDRDMKTGGWERTISICGQRVMGFCTRGIDCDDHRDGIDVRLTTLRSRLKMPHLPLSILMDIILKHAADPQDRDGVHADDYGDDLEEGDQWCQIVAKSNVVDWTAIICSDVHDSLIYGVAPASIPDVFYVTKADASKGQVWSILKSRRPLLLSTPDPVLNVIECLSMNHTDKNGVLSAKGLNAITTALGSKGPASFQKS